MNRIIVRFTIFFIAIYMIVVYINAWNGVLINADWYVILLDYCLFILASEDKKFHYKFARAIPVNMVFTDSIACIDNAYDIIPNTEIYLWLVTSTWIVSIIITVILGIAHFRKVRKLKKEKKNYEYKFK